jgi:hypothetical protein
MRINWVFASEYQIDPTVDISQIKHIGATWGGWKSWRSCQTDNVICDDPAKGRELLKRAFQAVCNFHVPRRYYQDFGRPVGTKLYDGQFAEQVDDIEDIIALHLVSSTSDIVLLAGFDLRQPTPTNDRFEQHKIQNRLGLIRSVIQNNPEIQWVLVDHPGELDKGFRDIANLTCDQFQNVVQLLT